MWVRASGCGPILPWDHLEGPQPPHPAGNAEPQSSQATGWGGGPNLH